MAARAGQSAVVSAPNRIRTPAIIPAKFDVTKTVGIMRGAPETLYMRPSDVKSTYLIIEPATDPTTPGALSLSLYVSSDYGGRHITFAGDGTVKQMSLPT
ncbi:hypothetical protein MUNTM_55360 [Mycobacterium sp. MUNTM1]